VLKKDGVISGISPLVRITTSHLGFSFRRLEFVGHEWDYNDLVLGDDPEGQIEAIVYYLAHTESQWDLIELRNLREADDAVARLAEAVARQRLPHRAFFEAERCPFLRLDGPWTEMLARFSPATRHGFRNRQARLVRMASDGLRLRIVDNPHQALGLLDRMIAVEAQKHVNGKPSLPFIGRYSDVFESLFESLGPKGWLSVAVMEINDRLIAWNLFFRCGRKLWGYLTAYDHCYAGLSPGTMLLPAIIEDGYAHGFDELDFLTGEESYKLRWMSGFHYTCRFLIHNRRVSSQLCSSVYSALRPGPPVGGPWAPRVPQTHAI